MIPVEPANEVIGHDTAEAAIAAAREHPLQAKARQDATAFLGRTFVDAWSDTDQWILEFSGDVWLRVFVDGTRVAWTVQRARPPVPAASDSIVLEWSTGHQSHADPESLAADRRGAVFWQFWVNDVGFFVYLRGRLILCFSVVRRRDTGEFLLHVWEDD